MTQDYQDNTATMDGLIFGAPDMLLRATIMGGQARIMMCRTTRLTQEASDTHLASDVATAAIGRILSGTAIVSAMLKEDKGSVTITFAGDGAGGKVTSVGRGGNLKISLENPQAELPKLNGKQDVEGFIGRNGRLTVIKDMGAGEPYVGASALVSGGVAQDLTQYFAVSEQTPSLIALGCLNSEGAVLSSGGILIQPMPGCKEKTLQMVEMRIPFFSNISRELYDRSMEELLGAWFRDMDLEILDEKPLGYKCDCSREKMTGALIATGEKELRSMLEENDDVEMVCWFCRTRRVFSPDDIKKLLTNAQLPREDVVYAAD